MRIDSMEHPTSLARYQSGAGFINAAYVLADDNTSIA